MNAEEERWRWVADAIIRRRMELGIETQEDLAKRAGTSGVTIVHLENAQQASYRAATLRKVALALGWSPEAIVDLLHAGPPDISARLLALEARSDERDRVINRLVESVQRLERRLERPPGRAGR